MYKTGTIVHHGKPISNFLINFKDLQHGQDLPSNVRFPITSLDILNPRGTTFLKTAGLTGYSSIPILATNTLAYVAKPFFQVQNLQKGDLLISKDSNVGEAVILDKNYPSMMVCGGLWLPHFKNDKDKWLVFAYLLTNQYKEQLKCMVPRGSTLKHAGKKVFYPKIPDVLIKNDSSKIINIAKNIVNDDSYIKRAYHKAMNLLDKDLQFTQIQSNNVFSINDIKQSLRFDSGFYSSVMRNYWKMYHDSKSQSIKELGYDIPRGQNLQKSNIGISKKSSYKFPNSILAIKPRYISSYGFPTTTEYIGNRHSLKTLKSNDILFGAEATNRSFIIPRSMKAITNIHGLMIRPIKRCKDAKLSSTSVTIKYLLDYYRETGVIDSISAGGHGGSLAPIYWKYIKFPLIDDHLKQILTKLYSISTKCWLNHNKSLNMLNRLTSNY